MSQQTINDNEMIDILVIGAGTAGLTAYKTTKRIAPTVNIKICDPGPLGTTCARVGCMPSKSLIQIANNWNSYKKLNNLGLTSDSSGKINISKVLEHVRKQRDKFILGPIGFLEKQEKDGCFIRGKARIVGKNPKGQYEVEISFNHTEAKSHIRAKKIIIATGGKAFIPDQWNLPKDKIKSTHSVLTTENFFEQKDIDQKFAVVGMGVIGLEIGQALANLDIETYLFGDYSKIAGIQDPIIQKHAHQVFEKQSNLNIVSSNVHLKLNEQGQVEISTDTQEVTEKFTFNQVLVATGRRPSIADLGLDNIGIETSNFNSFKEQLTNNLEYKDTGLYFCGDINATNTILHEASDEGHIGAIDAISKLKNESLKKGSKRRTPLSIVFSSPQISSVGMTYEETQKSSDKYIYGSSSLERQGRAITMLENTGSIRVYAEKATGKIVGAEMICPKAENIAHELAWAIRDQKTVHDMLKGPFYHPVIEESLRDILRDLAKNLTLEQHDPLFD